MIFALLYINTKYKVLSSKLTLKILMSVIEDYLKKQNKISIKKDNIHYHLIFFLLIIITILFLLLTPIGHSTLKTIKHTAFSIKQS